MLESIGGLDKQRKSSMGGYLSKRYTKFQGEDERTKRSRSNIRSRLQQSYDTPLSTSKDKEDVRFNEGK